MIRFQFAAQTQMSLSENHQRLTGEYDIYESKN